MREEWNIPLRMLMEWREYLATPFEVFPTRLRELTTRGAKMSSSWPMTLELMEVRATLSTASAGSSDTGMASFSSMYDTASDIAMRKPLMTLVGCNFFVTERLWPR